MFARMLFRGDPVYQPVKRSLEESFTCLSAGEIPKQTKAVQKFAQDSPRIIRLPQIDVIFHRSGKLEHL